MKYDAVHLLRVAYGTKERESNLFYFSFLMTLLPAKDYLIPKN